MYNWGGRVPLGHRFLRVCGKNVAHGDRTCLKVDIHCVNRRTVGMPESGMEIAK